jgi:hypothetical protein
LRIITYGLLFPGCLQTKFITLADAACLLSLYIKIGMLYLSELENYYSMIIPKKQPQTEIIELLNQKYIVFDGAVLGYDRFSLNVIEELS